MIDIIMLSVEILVDVANYVVSYEDKPSTALDTNLIVAQYHSIDLGQPWLR